MISLIIIAIIFLIAVFKIIFQRVKTKIKLLFGYKLYEYTKILSHGMKNSYMWHKSDEKALEFNTDYEFVDVIAPYNKRLKPLK
jgi:hypothetical protein